MALTPRELRDRLSLPQFPRCSAYDPEWVVEHSGGPNVLWLTEALSQVVDLQPGMRVLDMGCGRAISSIFLAREFDVQVWATDLWVAASDNWERILDAGEQSRVFPIHAEAHTLPFADGFFDLAFSVDAYHYFGTDDLYIDCYSRLVKSGGQIGIVVPGLVEELSEGVPDDLAPYWPWDFCSFHSPHWWRHHWEKSGKIGVEHADLIPDGADFWLQWNEVCQAHSDSGDSEETKLVRIDGGRQLGFSRVVGRVTAPPVTTDLQRAIGRGNSTDVSALLEDGADPNGRNRSGSTALHHAIWAASQGRISEETLIEIIDLLLGRGADVNALHPRQGTPLDQAQNGLLERVSKLIADRGGESSQGE